MILLGLIAFLHLPSIADSHRDHLSEALRLKCDALPYRTIFVDDRCYFAVHQEIEFSKAQEECSDIFFGAKVSTDAPSSIFDSLMVEKSKFHIRKATSGSKQFICAYDSGYKCDASETMMSNGRCVVRAPKRMNFVDAKKYCEGIGMELPAPANDMDNRIVRDGLKKDPAWVAKSFVAANGFKWREEMPYSRWSACNLTSSQCNKDRAAVVDSNGYWSDDKTEHLMEVVCLKSAENPFTKRAVPCNYHEANVEKFAPLTGAACGTVYSSTCYTLSQTTNRYEIFGKATVETQRGCEVLCNNMPQCIAFSYKDNGFSSSCVLHSFISSEICSAPRTIFVKKTSGCVARTNITAEFGNDPCIDEMVPSAFRGLNQITICEKPKGTARNWHNPRTWRFVRAIDVCGRRITLDNAGPNWIEQAGDSFRFRYRKPIPAGHPYRWLKTLYEHSVDIVAASCVIGGDEKCPCAPLAHQSSRDGSRTYPATTNKLIPCKNGGSALWYNVASSPDFVHYEWARNYFLACQAGMWMASSEKYDNYWGLTAASCYN